MKLSELDTPAVVVDVDIMERNLRRLSDYCKNHGLKLRPHTKTHKIPELAQKQVQYGAVGITVAKVGEAETMVDAGLDDILIAYPIFGNEKWRRLVALARRARITVACDSLEIASSISDRTHAAGLRVGVLVEFDTGTLRCGLPVERDSIEIVRRIASLPGLEFRGLLVYPGHFLTGAEERERLLVLENEKLSWLMEMVRSSGIGCEVVSGGSTPAAYMSHRFVAVNEIRSGTYIFNDRNTVGCGAAVYEDCALSIIVSVVSTSVPGRAIVDGGSKTFSSDRWLSGDGRGYGLVVDDPGIFFEAMSEEHGHLSLEGASLSPKVGDRLRIIPNHVCASVNMHDRIHALSGDELVGEWKVAGRGRVR